MTPTSIFNIVFYGTAHMALVKNALVYCLGVVVTNNITRMTVMLFRMLCRDFSTGFPTASMSTNSNAVATIYDVDGYQEPLMLLLPHKFVPATQPRTQCPTQQCIRHLPRVNDGARGQHSVLGLKSLHEGEEGVLGEKGLDHGNNTGWSSFLEVVPHGGTVWEKNLCQDLKPEALTAESQPFALLKP